MNISDKIKSKFSGQKFKDIQVQLFAIGRSVDKCTTNIYTILNAMDKHGDAVVELANTVVRLSEHIKVLEDKVERLESLHKPGITLDDNRVVINPYKNGPTGSQVYDFFKPLCGKCTASSAEKCSVCMEKYKINTISDNVNFTCSTTDNERR